MVECFPGSRIETLILINSFVKLRIPTHFGWLYGFGRTSRFWSHILVLLIISLLLQKCCYFHLKYKLWDGISLTQMKKCFRVSEYHHLCTSTLPCTFCDVFAILQLCDFQRNPVFCYINIV